MHQANDPKPSGPQGRRAGAPRADRAEKKAAARAASFELWYGDGVKFELLPVVTYAWRRRGHPLRIATPGSNRRVAVCGAMRWPNGPFRFGFGFRQVNTDVFVELLPQLAQHARRVGRRIVLVLDNGTYFRSRRSTAAIAAAASWLTIFWLPRYSSEQLNAIEGLWRHLEDDYFSRMLVTEPTDFGLAVVRFLQRLQQPGRLRRVLKPRSR